MVQVLNAADMSKRIHTAKSQPATAWKMSHSTHRTVFSLLWSMLFNLLH